jgi:hypothetical protein
MKKTKGSKGSPPINPCNLLGKGVAAAARFINTVEAVINEDDLFGGDDFSQEEDIKPSRCYILK